MKNMPSLRRRVLAVFCGGFCGTLVRYGLSSWIQGMLGKGWPFDILFINLTGAFLFALFSIWAETGLWITPTLRLLLNAGFLGAYTTFSSLALGSVLLFSHGSFLSAGLYLGCSFFGGLFAILMGDWLGMKIACGVGHRQPPWSVDQVLSVDQAAVVEDLSLAAEDD